MNRRLDSIGLATICRLTPSRRIKDNLFAFRDTELLAHCCLFILISKPQFFIAWHAATKITRLPRIERALENSLIIVTRNREVVQRIKVIILTTRAIITDILKSNTVPCVQVNLTLFLKLQTTLDVCIGNPIFSFQCHLEVSRSINLYSLQLREIFRMLKRPNATIALVLRVRLHIVIQDLGTIIEVFSHKRDKEDQFVIRF